MMRAVLLFWPANVLPLYLLITLLQIYIPLNYLMRQLVVGVKQHKKHTFAALTILLSVGVNSGTLSGNWKQYGPYYIMMLVSAFFELLSITMKESLVRT
jgi:predicted metallopeptidase